jgi:SAM-dependent methyltransferase
MSLNELHKKLHKHLDEQSKNWKSFIYAQEKGFYQGFEELEIEGWRPSKKRFNSYEINNYLSENKVALDIGSNCGFFSLYVSKFVKQIDGVEINPYLINIANDVKEYLKSLNSNFFNSSFENFSTEKKYDVIFSLANDSTIDKNTKFNFYEYLDKILNLLKKDGLLIFESQAIDVLRKSQFDKKFDVLKSHFDVLKNTMVDSEYPVNVPQRFFLVLKRS